MLTCQELTELVTEYAEGRMGPWRRIEFWMHLGMCKHCRAYVSQLRATVRAVGALPPEPVPPEVKDELLERLRHMRPAR
ncbi:MAG: zf-HC2 domain-containing protein [Polyangiaceae bacterium]|nr:zf-HC2 domain-containing protein [Polyangiaceae bacterium]